jgi:hypothetical protein
MEATTEAIIEYVARRASEVWEEKQQPYLLALLSPDLRANGVEYKAVLGPIKLKEFLQTQAADKVKLITHPTQKAKVGVIPNDKEFAYETSASTAGQPGSVTKDTSTSSRPQNARVVVLNFLQLLGTLSSEDLEGVQIPASVLVKLLSAR